MTEFESRADGFVKIAEFSEIRDGKGISRKLLDDDVALVRLGGEVIAFINVCPHQHTRLVDSYGGQIAGEELTCPMHGWTYNLRNGKCVNQSGKLKLLEVKIEDGSVYVKRVESTSLW